MSSNTPTCLLIIFYNRTPHIANIFFQCKELHILVCTGMKFFTVISYLRTDLTFHMSFAYSAMVLSLENLPEQAVFTRLILCQFSLSL